MLSVKNLVKIYQQKKADPVRALDGVTIDFADTGLVFLLGKSGSGKSTLLNAIGGLDTFDEGEIIIKASLQKSSLKVTSTHTATLSSGSFSKNITFWRTLPLKRTWRLLLNFKAKSQIKKKSTNF